MKKKYNMYLSNGKKYIITEEICEKITNALTEYGKGVVKWGGNIINIMHVTHIETQKEKRTKKEDVEMDLKQFIAYTQKSTQPHIQFIGDWADTTGADHTMKSQWDVYMKRHMRAAIEVVKFPRSQIVDALRKIKKDSNNFAKYQPTIETVVKYLTH